MSRRRFTYIYPDYPVYPEKVREFLKEVDVLSKKFGLSIAHEDSHGGFIIEKYGKGNIEWLQAAAFKQEV